MPEELNAAQQAALDAENHIVPEGWIVALVTCCGSTGKSFMRADDFIKLYNNLDRQDSEIELEIYKDSGEVYDPEELGEQDPIGKSINGGVKFEPYGAVDPGCC